VVGGGDIYRLPEKKLAGLENFSTISDTLIIPPVD
jgi:hypothetical protein